MDIVRALITTHYSPYAMLAAGELFPADDPLVRAHPDWFSADLEPMLKRTGPAVGDEPARRGPGRPRKIETTEANLEVTR